MNPIRTSILCMLAILLVAISSCKKDNNSNGFSNVSPANASNISSTQTFVCTPVSGAVSYTFYFNDGTGQISQSSSTDTVTVQNLKPCDSYSWLVIATKSDGTTISTTNWNFSVNGGTSIPCPLQPTNRDTNVCVTPMLSWTTIAGTGSYNVEVATDVNFYNVVVNQSLSNTYYTIPASTLSAASSYYWRVSAGSSYSPAFSFTTIGPPTLSSPANGSTGQARATSFGWSSSGCAVNFAIDVATDGGFGNVVYTEQTTGTTYTLPAGTLNAYATYYWRVRVLDYSATSSTWSYTTGLQ